MKEIKRLSFEEARDDPLTREQEREGQGRSGIQVEKEGQEGL